ncbi:MAG TPA: flagellar basal body P-ring formation chaperone FlgA [Tepidisphaeraceae bacterium]|jgi:flagella basal body P-ring formation protein FlgA
MYGNGRPLGLRKRMQIVVAVVLLAWATQTLLRQWGYCHGAEIPAAAASGSSDSGSSEKFVPGTARFAAGATLELRGDATILGAEVKLKQICRWSDSDAQVFLPVADLVIARIDHGSPFRSVTVDQIRDTLHDAGMNLAIVKFAGPLSCTITRSDASYDEGTALRLWAEAREPKGNDDAGTRGHGDAGQEKTGTQVVSGPPAEAKTGTGTVSGSSAGARVASSMAADDSPAKTLRGMLIDDLSVRLGVAKDQLQVRFNPADEKLLNLSEPLFKFNIQSRRVRDLGEVSWNVTVLSGNGSQKGTVTATARAWRNEVVLNKPLAYGQVIQPDDVIQRRVLADQLPSDPLLAQSQVVGQQASRDLKVGTVMNARLVDAVPLVKPGQLVTITLTVGSVRVKTVGRAMETGSFGQAVKVRNESTKDIFEVVLTGPQQGTMDPLPPAGADVARSDR